MNLAGFAGQSVLVLLDGERLAGETMDNVDFSRINLLNVERIEIVKGAASALYGSNATGGVVNIITKDARKPWNLNVNARVAGHRERRYGLAFACAGKYLKNSFTAMHTGIDTYTVCHNVGDACDFRKVYGGTTCNFTDKLVIQLPNCLKLTARAGYYFKERLYNPDTPDRYRDFSAGLKGEWQLMSVTAWNSRTPLISTTSLTTLSSTTRMCAITVMCSIYTEHCIATTCLMAMC